MRNVLVINMGLKSVRCIIFDKEGVKLGSASRAINTAINEQKVEQDPKEWWEKTQLVIANAIHDAGNSPIEYVTVTTSASCLVCVDKEGNSLDNAYMVSDRRAELEADELAHMPLFIEVKNKTHLDSSSSLMIPKILWVKKYKPNVFAKTRYFMTPNDFLIYKLCGNCVTDTLNALKYHYNAISKEYPMELLKQLEINDDTLPNVVNVGECVGNIDRTIADKLGLSDDVKVVITSYDAICSFVGSGALEEGEASDVSGTVTVLRAITRKREIKNNPCIYNTPLEMVRGQLVGGSNNLGGGVIEWVKQCYYQNEPYPYEIMEKDARESEIGAKGLIFLPYLLGERVPLWDGNARGVFFGLERMHTRNDMTRAVFESTGFLDLDIIEAIQETGIEVKSIRLSGGLARVNLISQIKADIMGRDIMVLSEFETTASGAAMMVLYGQKIYTDMKTIADKFALIRMVIHPNWENHKKYMYMYGLYKDTYQSLKEMFVKRTEVLQKIRNGREVQIENL